MNPNSNRRKRKEIAKDSNDNGNQSKYFKSESKAKSKGATVSNCVSSGDQRQNVDKDKVRDKLGAPFYEVDCSKLASALLGKTLVRKIAGGERVTGKIVETEAYLGLEDKAAHSYKGKRTERNEAMFMKPGTAYVYNIYGMYCCFNISSAGEGCAVLIRSLEPKEGLDTMRGGRTKETKKKQKDKDLTNGPSKLCQALQIKKDSCNKVDLTSSDELWLEDGDEIAEASVVKCPRINIGYAEDWVDKPLRFYIKDDPCVSVKFKG